jgi:hypothetical protein
MMKLKIVVTCLIMAFAGSGISAPEGNTTHAEKCQSRPDSSCMGYGIAPGALAAGATNGDFQPNQTFWTNGVVLGRVNDDFVNYYDKGDGGDAGDGRYWHTARLYCPSGTRLTGHRGITGNVRAPVVVSETNWRWAQASKGPVDVRFQVQCAPY